MFGNKYAADELARSFKTSVDKLKENKRKNQEDIKKAASDKVNAADFLIDGGDNQANDTQSTIDNSLKDLASMAKDFKNQICDMCGDSYAKDQEHKCLSSDKSQDKVARVLKGLAKVANSLKKKGNVKEASVVSNTIKEIKSDLVSMAKTKHVVDGLSKIASDLSKKGKFDAASYVLKAAGEIKAENAEKVSTPKPDYSYLVDKKAEYVLSELGKIAGSLVRDGNNFAADMVKVTASEIKNEAINKAAKKLETISGLKKMATEAYAEGDTETVKVIKATINNIKRS